MDEEEKIESLNRRFGIEGVVKAAPGNGGLAKICVRARAGSAEIYLHGAQVTSWRPAGGEEVVFLSSLSHWQSGRAIRGGIPICFPWFRAKRDDALAPAHGFVRTKEWRVESIAQDADGCVCAVFSTESDEETRRWWPHDFRLQHRILVGSSLSLELVVTNVGSSAFTFEEALHTYFRVGSAQSVRVAGLDGVTYLDHTDGDREKVQSGDVGFNGATDNAYIKTEGACDLIDPTLHRVIRTEKLHSGATVVWNPWQQGAAALADLGAEEWQHMACVEACNILSCEVLLGPGEAHSMRARLSVRVE